MKRRWFFRSAIVGAFLFGGAAFAGIHSMFEAGKHCVAYKVRKKSLSLFSSTIIGKNCEISVQLLPVVGGDYQVEVSIPINSFDSEDKERDRDVREILKESEQPDIVFRSKVMTEKVWRETLKKTSIKLDGDLEIAGKSYPVSVPVDIVKTAGGIEADGVLTVPFGKFDLQPPKVGGGVIAKVDSDLEMHFHIMSEKVLGADKAISVPITVKEPDLMEEVKAKKKIKEEPEVKPTAPVEGPPKAKAEGDAKQVDAKHSVEVQPAKPKPAPREEKDTE
jgi:hypothetical protein